MTATTRPTVTASTGSRSMLRVAGLLLILAGIAFLAYGPLHPSDSGGSKVDALGEMLEDPMWLPAHLVGLASYACFAAAALAIREGMAPGSTMRRVSTVVSVIGVAGTIAMVVHALGFLGADAVRSGGEDAFWYQVMTWNESLVNAVWALSIATLVVAGGLTRTVGDRIIMPLGLVGALAYALALATVPFIDTFDGLFPVSGLLAVWALIAGIMLLGRRVEPAGADR